MKHWAHKGERRCDSWWEETEWHRRWKEQFDPTWREVRHRDPETAEWHIADVKTEHGLVIECQRSPIAVDECDQREAFYKTMVWLVDCTRLKRDRGRFFEQQCRWTKLGKTTFLVPEPALPAAWRRRSAPVFLDFAGVDPAIDLPDEARTFLWCIVPALRVNAIGGGPPDAGSVIVLSWPREGFIDVARSQAQIVSISKVREFVTEALKLQEQLRRRQAQFDLRMQEVARLTRRSPSRRLGRAPSGG